MKTFTRRIGKIRDKNPHFLLTNGKWCGKIRKLFVRTDGVKQKMKRFVRKKFLTNGNIGAKLTQLPAKAAMEKIHSKKFEKT